MLRGEPKLNTEQFLNEVEIKGMGTPKRSGGEPLLTVDKDQLSFDVAEDYGLDKDEDQAGLVFNNGLENIRVIPTDNYNDIGEEIFDDEELETDGGEDKPKIIKTTRTAEQRLKEAERIRNDREINRYYKGKYNDFDGHEDEVVAVVSQSAGDGRQWRDSIPEHPVDSEPWAPLETDKDLEREELGEKFESKKLSLEERKRFEKSNKFDSGRVAVHGEQKPIYNSRKGQINARDESFLKKHAVNTQKGLVGEMDESLTKPVFLDDSDIRARFNQNM